MPQKPPLQYQRSCATEATKFLYALQELLPAEFRWPYAILRIGQREAAEVTLKLLLARILGE